MACIFFSFSFFKKKKKPNSTTFLYGGAEIKLKQG